jgi:PAS domain S-box-containing protein
MEEGHTLDANKNDKKNGQPGENLASAATDQPNRNSVIGPNCADILDAIPFYALLVDSDHFILHANKAVQTELGLDPREIVGGYCPKVIHGLDTPFYGCPLEEAVKINQAVEWEVYDTMTKRWVRSAIYPTNLTSDRGKKIFFHLVTDITRAKQAEQQLAASHERLRTISSHLETVREEERKRIARDLHDETSQVVSSLSAHIEAAVNVLPPAGDKARSLLQKAQQLSISILDELHKVIYELHPFLLDDLGLVPAVESLIENNIKTKGPEIQLKIQGKAKRLNSQLEMTLFRVIQEALNNIVRHAGARHATVTIRFQKSEVIAAIEDDGVGFDVAGLTDVANRRRGFGLLGMRERIGLIDGTIDIDSKPNAGTSIKIRVPLNIKPPAGTDTKEKKASPETKTV